MKKYYALKFRNDRGSREHVNDWVLYDKEYSRADLPSIKHGFFPWYATNRNLKIEEFPEKAHLICNSGPMEFDMRS
ncbi:hypothetical protein [Chitinilyticum piscinae]|uniref:Uncharacterized protein n=1 Tax=Chitinilyticum piscinae TaxID=2866724 RepID=A0A8J7KCT0_9NEIS|nr:hypothetical protein [Chitinilyticum piscinae]MBE9608064.1 hypothetical protein [Chitinilyticum piscinae]